VFLGFTSTTLPVIAELKGYGIESKRAENLASHHKANQLNIEYRLF
jgi:hypothetical protein